MDIVFTNCTNIDCTASPPIEHSTIVIRGDRITDLRVGAVEGAKGEDARVFDLGGSYVLPGLWLSSRPSTN